MEITPFPKKKRSQRTTPEQLRYFVSFCKKHPEVETRINSHLSPRAVQKLWDQLSQELNAMKGPTRTASKWKDILFHWKSLVRYRTRKDKEKQKMAVGRPPTIQIVAVEEQAMQKFDSVTTNVFADDTSLGFDEMQLDNNEDRTAFKSILMSESSLSPMNSTPVPSDRTSLSLPSEAQINISCICSSKRDRIDHLLHFAFDNVESQNRREAAEHSREAAEHRREAAEQRREAAEQRRAATQQQQHELILASNLKLQKTLEKMSNCISTFTEVLAKILKKKTI